MPQAFCQIIIKLVYRLKNYQSVCHDNGNDKGAILLLPMKEKGLTSCRFIYFIKKASECIFCKRRLNSSGGYCSICVCILCYKQHFNNRPLRPPYPMVDTRNPLQLLHFHICNQCQQFSSLRNISRSNPGTLQRPLFSDRKNN